MTLGHERGRHVPYSYPHPSRTFLRNKSVPKAKLAVSAKALVGVCQVEVIGLGRRGLLGHFPGSLQLRAAALSL